MNNNNKRIIIIGHIDFSKLTICAYCTSTWHSSVTIKTIV